MAPLTIEDRDMTHEMILAFARHMVKRNRKGKPVKLPQMNGAKLDQLLKVLERVHGYS